MHKPKKWMCRGFKKKKKNEAGLQTTVLVNKCKICNEDMFND